MQLCLQKERLNLQAMKEQKEYQGLSYEEFEMEAIKGKYQSARNPLPS